MASARALQTCLFEPAVQAPEGFRLQAELIDACAEAQLIATMADLPFAPFDFYGHKAHREVVHYGWRYDYGSRRIGRADPLPGFLDPLRARAAAFAGVSGEALQQALINAYRPGAGIGWHRDKAHFEAVVAVSLGAPASLRLRRRLGASFERRTLTIPPRSAYLLSGPARWEWEHSIAPGDQPRWSITFRTLSARPDGALPLA